MLFDPGSFREAGALVQHRCTDFGMAEQQIFGGQGGAGAGRPRAKAAKTALAQRRGK